MTGIDPITGLENLAQDALDKFVPDANKKMELEAQSDQAQIAVNQVEAGNASLFVSGWRPAVGWLCVFALAYQAVIRQMAFDIATLLGYNITMPAIDTAMLIQLLLTLLGVGSMRSYDKKQGIDTKSIKLPWQR